MEGILRSEEAKKAGNQMTSAMSPVEGAIREACDDACSICLEDFSKSDPSTITNCKHEFHLQCILEWAQRSSQCPMCWQAISMEDPVSQELFENVEQERNFRINQSRNAAIFRHPTIGSFELQHLPLNESEVEMEEHILQRIAAATGVGRGYHISRRESLRTRSSLLARPQFLVFSAPGAPPGITISSSSTHVGGQIEPTPPSAVSASIPLTNAGDAQNSVSLSPVQTDQSSPIAGLSAPWTTASVLSGNRIAAGQSSLGSEDGTGPSDFQSFSESVKSRISAMSMRYRESFSRSTRGWKEKWLARSSSMADLGSEVQREVNAGIATVSRMLECFERGENNRARHVPVTSNAVDRSNIEPTDRNNAES
ncbi:hypothetical protein Ancab_015093 [Ancistrocladus abbreviatus]